MNKVGILPNLWFDREAEEAARFYTSVFEHSRLGRLTWYPGAGFEAHGMPEGTVWTVDFELEGQRFVAFNAGPLFKFNPSVSFFVNLDPSQDRKARERIDALWEAFSAGGMVLMPLGSYSFSERYGWIQDKYGLSWQLILSDPEGERRPPVFPSLMFVGGVAGRAEEAIDFYLSVFGNSKRGITARYGKGQEPNREGTIMFADFMIEGRWFAAMDSAGEHHFTFNEATSLMVECQTQEQTDYYWGALASGGGEEGVCGWLKDRFGVSWQVIPTVLAEMLADRNRDKVERVTNAFLKMNRINIAELQRAFDGQTAAGSDRGATWEGAMTTLNIYLNFAGNAEEAFAFYRSTFGGEFTSLIRFRDMPMEGITIPEEDQGKIMHIALPVSRDHVLMASDSIEALDQKLVQGNNVYISVHPDSKEEADRIFRALSAGGLIEMPIADQIWGDYYGSLTDKFGVGWMVMYAYSGDR